MSEYGCNDLIPHSKMVFINGGLTTNPLLYEVDPVKPEFTLTFRITVKAIRSGVWSLIILKGEFYNLIVFFRLGSFRSMGLIHDDREGDAFSPEKLYKKIVSRLKV